MIVIKVQGNASLQHSKLQMGGLGDGLCSCTQKNPSVSKHSRLCGSSMKSVSIHTFARVCDGSVVQSGRTLVSKTKCQRFKSFRGRQKIWGCSSVGRAFGLQPKCRRFDPCHLHHVRRARSIGDFRRL